MAQRKYFRHSSSFLVQLLPLLPPFLFLFFRIVSSIAVAWLFDVWFEIFLTRGIPQPPENILHYIHALVHKINHKHAQHKTYTIIYGTYDFLMRKLDNLVLHSFVMALLFIVLFSFRCSLLTQS